MDLTSVYFTDANNGFAVGYSGTILKTIDGGTVWNVLSSGTPSGFYSVFFINGSIGYATGEIGTCLQTNDGGITWTANVSGTTNWLYSVHFVDSNTGYAVGGNGTILKALNGGGVYIDEPTTSKQKFSIYPNPAQNKIIITNTNKGVEGTSISIINNIGELLFHDIFQNQNKIEIFVNDLINGIYLIKIQTKLGIEIKKIVIQK